MPESRGERTGDANEDAIGGTRWSPAATRPAARTCARRLLIGGKAYRGRFLALYL